MLADRSIPLRAPHARIRGKGDDSWREISKNFIFLFFLEILNNPYVVS